MPEEDRVRQSCAYLRMLLFRPGDYRSRWERHARDIDGPRIDPQAVATVLQERKLRRSSGMEESRVLTRPAEELVRVARHALDGSMLSPADLEDFIAAFGLTVRHAHRLRELRRGSPSVLAIYRDLRPIGDGYRHAGPPHHDTLSFHELHTIGPDGRPAEHETIQVIRSTVPWLESVPYRFDTDELVVHMVRGGQVGPRVYQVNETVYGVDILLAQPLALGETALLQHHTTFAYQTHPPPELRRAVLRATEELTMWVRFHPQRVPARVWSARWDRIDQARVIERSPVELDSELSVHARFGRVEQAVVGLYWEWD
ncbi:MAG TPA: hypothetical protein VJT31_30540 [Rugosimonospora sp.]|nr:hypothetical protein [Rugosimonospora sp.]